MSIACHGFVCYIFGFFGEYFGRGFSGGENSAIAYVFASVRKKLLCGGPFCGRIIRKYRGEGRAAVAGNGKKKKGAGRREPRFVGMGPLFAFANRRLLVPVPAASAAAAVLAVLARFTGIAFFYALFYVSLVTLSASVAVPASRLALFASDPSGALCRVPEGARRGVRPGTLAAAFSLPVLLSSLFASAAAFASLSMIISVKLALAGAAAFFSATFYVSMTFMTVSASHSVSDRRGRRGFILGFAVLYAVGLVVLILIFAITSSIPLGEDFTGGNVPAETVLGLSMIYMLAAAVRAVYLFFILRKRLSAKTGPRKKHASNSANKK